MHDHLPRLRRSRGLSQQTVAAALGVSLRTYRRIERGERPPDPHQIRLLEQLFQLEAGSLEAIRPMLTDARRGARVRTARRMKGWSQERLADVVRAAGIPVSREMIARLEQERIQHPDPGLLAAVAAALDLPPSELGAPDSLALAIPDGTLTDLAWELFYHASPIVYALMPAISVWLSRQPSPSERTARLWQLYGVLLRDQQDPHRAIEALTRGIAHAEAAGDVDLMAAGLMRRARAYADLAEARPDLAPRAIHDGRRAMEFAPACRPTLRGALLTQWIKTMALDAPGMRDLEAPLDAASSLAAVYGGRDPTGMHLGAAGVIHAGIDGAVLVMERAGRSPDDHLLIRTESIRILLSPQHRRWHGAVSLSTADMFARCGQVDAALETLAATLPDLTAERYRQRARMLIARLPPSRDRRMLQERLHGR